MIITVINAAAVIAGGLLGLLLKGRVPEKYKLAVTSSIGLVTLVLGMRMALEGHDVQILIPSLVAGGLIGTALKIESGILKAGESLKKLIPTNEDSSMFARGFLDASILFCVGPMTIIGSIQAGLSADYSIIFTKTFLDGFMALVLASAFGSGVVFSALSILVIQGGITLGASALSSFFSENVLLQIGSMGGYLILMIALDLLGLKRIKTANFLPALVLAALLGYFMA